MRIRWTDWCTIPNWFRSENTDIIKILLPEGSNARGRYCWTHFLEKIDGILVCKMKLNLELHLEHLLTSTYHALKTSGFMILPSDQQIDIIPVTSPTNQVSWMKLISNFFFFNVSPSLPHSRKCVTPIFDEMKIKEILMCNKRSGKIIGFTSLWDFNDVHLNWKRWPTSSC